MSFTSESEDEFNWMVARNVTSNSRFTSENEDIDNMRRLNAANVGSKTFDYGRSAKHYEHYHRHHHHQGDRCTTFGYNYLHMSLFPDITCMVLAYMHYQKRHLTLFNQK